MLILTHNYLWLFYFFDLLSFFWVRSSFFIRKTELVGSCSIQISGFQMKLQFNLKVQ
jgi:hypothetical protein